MRVALVHDYLKEYGGAERVLEALHEIWPNAPIYTAFYTAGSEAYKRLNPSTSLRTRGAKIVPSWVHFIPGFATKLHSPLRFLAPLIWGSFNFSDYDVVISSASWYITKGFIKRKAKSEKRKTIEICYCHAPPRWLYGYKTAVEWQRFLPIKIYAMIVGHFMRQYDFKAAQNVDYFIANSKETQGRIKKFYRRDSTVIYPPVGLPSTDYSLQQKKNAVVSSQSAEDYFLVVSRIVGNKGIELAVEAAENMGFTLKIVGTAQGYTSSLNTLSKKVPSNVEFLGFVSDEELVKLYSGAKAFLALAQDEDFGITPVEAMSCGTPVIAFFGGGYKETVIDGKTGVFFDEPTVEGLIQAIKQFNNITINSQDCIKQAQKFSKKRFQKEIKEFVSKHSHK